MCKRHILSALEADCRALMELEIGNATELVRLTTDFTENMEKEYFKTEEQ